MRKGKNNTKDTLASFKQNFSYLLVLIFLTLASEALWQAPHRCTIALFLIFRIRIFEDDSILDDHIWLTIRASSVNFDKMYIRHCITRICEITRNVTIHCNRHFSKNFFFDRNYSYNYILWITILKIKNNYSLL